MRRFSIYFAGSIAGGSNFKKQQQDIVLALEELGHFVVSRQHAFTLKSEKKTIKPKDIFERDIWWLLKKSQVMVAEVSTPSFGLGFEAGVAGMAQIPVIALVAEEQKGKISAFVEGVSHMGHWQVVYYPKNNPKKIKGLLKKALSKVKIPHFKGKYIAFEGMNQCGKGTQIEMLAKRLDKEGIDYEIVKEPGKTWLGWEIRKLLQAQEEDIPTIRAEVALLMAQRAHLVEKLIIPSLKKGKLVISDRSMGTSLSFQGLGRKEGIIGIAGLNNYAVKQVIPHLTLFLDISLEEMKRRKGKEEDEPDGPDRFDYKEKLDFTKRCFRGYKKVIQLDRKSPPKRWKVIDGHGTREEVHNKVWESIKKVLNEK